MRAGDGMGFTAFRTEKSVSEEILRGEEVEVGGWEAVFGSGELRSFFRCSGGFMGFVFGGVVRYFRLLGSYPVGGGGVCSRFPNGEGILGSYAGMFSSVRTLICVVPQEQNCAKAISTARWRRRRR